MCNNVAVFGSLTAVVIVLGSGAALATTANTISIEKDWVVVIADKNADVLAGKKLTLSPSHTQTVSHTHTLSLERQHASN